MGLWEEALVRLLRGVKTGLVGPGDDYDCVRLKDELLCFNVDGFAAKHVKLPFMDLKDVGWRGVVASLSDLIAKGCKPLAILFSIYASSEENATEMTEGVMEAIRSYDLIFLGADTNEGEEAIDVTSVCMTDFVIPIGGASPGDAVVLPKGCWGCVAKCLKGHFLQHCKRPTVSLKHAKVISKYSSCIKASTDSSDSLAISLWRIARASDVSIHISEVPKPEFVSYEEALFSGEEYLPVLVVERDCANDLAKEIDGIVAGEVGEGPPLVTFRGNKVEPEGWEWFNHRDHL